MDFSAVELQDLLGRVITLFTDWGLQVLGALVLLILGRMIAKAIRKAIRKTLERGKMDATLVPFISSLCYYLVMAFVLIAVLGMVGIQTASMIAVLGAAGLAVGLALQGTMSNFASGVMLLSLSSILLSIFSARSSLFSSMDIAASIRLGPGTAGSASLASLRLLFALLVLGYFWFSA